jgi:hypothetical protein
MDEQWGVGDQADAKAFDTIAEGELIFGQFPHTRRDDSIYLRRPNGTITPFNGFRNLIDIQIKSSNYNKDSYWSGDEIRKSVEGIILSDGVPVYEVFGREVQYVMKQIERLIDELSEHESRWFDKKSRDALVGRKIWYYNQPAIIKSLIESQGCMMIETLPGFVPPTRKDDDDDDDDFDYWEEEWKVDGHYEVKEEVLTPHVWWWRN